MTGTCPACEASELECRREMTVVDFMARLTGLGEGCDELAQMVESTENEIGTEGYTLVGCRSCGLEFADPMRQPGGRWYAQVYGRYCPNSYHERWEFEVVAAQVEAGQRLLELGSGDGRFLRRAGQRGARAMGVDLNPDALQAARAKGLTVFDDLAEVSGEFDWVCMFHTLEHLSDPRRAVVQALVRCREGGRLAISVPSRRSYIEFIWGESVLSLPPHHMTNWSESSMRRFLGSLGLVEECLEFEPLPRRLFRRRYAEELARRGPLSPLMVLPRGKALVTRLAMVCLRKRIETAAGGLSGKSMLAIYRKPGAR